MCVVCECVYSSALWHGNRKHSSVTEFIAFPRSLSFCDLPNLYSFEGMLKIILAVIFHLYFFFCIILYITTTFWLKSEWSLLKASVSLYIPAFWKSSACCCCCFIFLNFLYAVLAIICHVSRSACFCGCFAFFLLLSPGGLTIVCVVPSTWPPAVHWLYKTMLKAHSVEYKYQSRNQQRQEKCPTEEMRMHVSSGGGRWEVVPLADTSWAVLFETTDIIKSLQKISCSLTLCSFSQVYSMYFTSY